ncbi:helix-turn-helix domain-containing protein [Chloroflexota bacterium]
MDSKQFSRIRLYIDKTQEQLAESLDVSLRTIQSYEKGRRNIPSKVERLMLLFLVTSNQLDKSTPPCWNVKNCPNKWREECTVWELQSSYFCWFINGTCCEGQVQASWEDKMRICRECDVYTEMFQPYSDLLDKYPRSNDMESKS